MVKLLFWLKQVWIAVDQLGNALLFGWADETLSARTWRCRTKPVAKVYLPFINSLFFWQNNHCRGAYNSEKIRNQLPAEYRNLEQ